MTPNERDLMIEKVRKLMRLSHSSNPNEAALAAQKAQEIMEKYEIQQAMLELETNKEDPVLAEKIEDFSAKGDWLDVNPAFKGHRLKSQWAGRLAVAVCRANACFVYQATRRRDDGRDYHHLAIVGRPSDVETVRYMYAWLSSECERLIKANTKGASVAWRSSYASGLVAGISEALKIAKTSVQDQMRASAASATALAVVEKALVRTERRSQEVTAWANAHGWRGSGYGRGGSFGTGETSARELGRQHGRQVGIGANRPRLGSKPKELA